MEDEMKETGIIMSGNHPKLILDGRKTMTRRVIKPQSDTLQFQQIINFENKAIAQFREVRFNNPIDIACPYGQVGDRLWVRETWAAQFIYDDYSPRDIPKDSVIFYKTHDRLKLEIAKEHRDLGKWRPSIHMPRWASRITLEITDIRVERVQEISDKDCITEGCPHALVMLPTVPMQEWYKHLWDSINAKRGYSWEANPWVWIISFNSIEDE